jgi:hypothetical protein
MSEPSRCGHHLFRLDASLEGLVPFVEGCNGEVKGDLTLMADEAGGLKRCDDDVNQSNGVVPFTD